MKENTIKYNTKETILTLIFVVIIFVVMFYYTFSLRLGAELSMLWIGSNLLWMIGATAGLVQELIGITKSNKDQK